MKLSKESYRTMTSEQLEAHIDEVDWTLVPERLITPELAEKFSCFPQIEILLKLKNVFIVLKERHVSK